MAYILDIKNNKYNLGCVPNIIIGYYLHNLNMKELNEDFQYSFKCKILDKIEQIVDICITNVCNNNLYDALKIANIILKYIELLEECAPLVELVYYRNKYYNYCLDMIRDKQRNI
jgi:hypothetical protein